MEAADPREVVKQLIIFAYSPAWNAECGRSKIFDDAREINLRNPQLPGAEFKPRLDGSNEASSELNDVRKRVYPNRTSLTCVGSIVERKLADMSWTRVGEVCANAGSREPLPKPPSDPSGNI